MKNEKGFIKTKNLKVLLMLITNFWEHFGENY